MVSDRYRIMLPERALDRPLSIVDLATMLMRRWMMVLMCAVSAVLGCLVYLFFQDPVFESTAKILVNHTDDYEKQIGMVGARPLYDPVSTEMAIIKSRSTIERVVDELQLLSAEHDGELAEEAKTKEIERLLKKLKVEREKDTNVLMVSYQAGDPHTAKEVVDCVIRQYQKQRPRLSRDERAFEFFDRQIVKLKTRIDSLEYGGVEYRNAEEVLLPDRQSEILFASMADFDRELTRVRAQRIARESRLRALQEQGNEPAVASLSDGEWSQAEHLNQLRQTLFQLQNRRNSLKLRYTDKHPEVQAVLHDIQNTEEEIRKQISSMIEIEETAVRMLKAQESELTRSMSGLAGRIADLSRKEYELGRRTIGINELKQVYAALLRHREEARIAADKKEILVRVQVLDWGNLPAEPCSPSIILSLSVFALIGAVVGAAWSFMAENLNRSIYSIDDAVEATGLQVIAVVSDADLRPASLHAPQRRILAENSKEKIYQ